MKKLRSTLVALGAAFGMTLAGLGVASAQTSDAPPAAQSMARHRHGAGMGIHGEFVARNAEGGFQTIASQRGEVTGSSASALTVKSEDGFTRTYVVNGDTRVNRGDGSMDDVVAGDRVNVRGIVSGNTTTATNVHEADRPKTRS